MRAVFHAGELAVQAREGVVDQARRLSGMIGDRFPDDARAFFAEQRLVVVATVDDETGEVWASFLSGARGFASVVGPRQLTIRADAAGGDPLARTLRDEGPMGLLAIEPATRRRMKAKGRAQRTPDGYALEAASVYSLCPKYIQARELALEAKALGAPGAPEANEHAALTLAEQAWIARADTAFLATWSTGGGPDASHRGGAPGFLRVISPTHLAFPDYAGNNMFNSLGNLALSPRAGLSILDYETGATLALSGSAEASWDPAELRVLAGARRVVHLTIRRVVEIRAAHPAPWRFLGASRFNP